MIAISIVFLAGIANFAMHRAVLESRDPDVAALVESILAKVGSRTTYLFEFVFLTLGLMLAERKPVIGVALYAAYTGLNIMAYWALVGSRR